MFNCRLDTIRKGITEFEEKKIENIFTETYK